MIQVFRIIAGGHDKDEELLAAGRSAQFATKIDSAFARQHPIQNQKRKRFFRQFDFGFFGTANRNHFVTAPLY